MTTPDEPTAGEILAGAIEWRLAGGGFPPPPIASLSIEEQGVLWQGADDLYRVVEEKVASIDWGDDQ